MGAEGLDAEWSAALDLGEGGSAATAEDASASDEQEGAFARMRSSLSRTRRALAAELFAGGSGGALDDDDWERLEEALVLADVGVPTTVALVGRLEEAAAAGEISTVGDLRDRLEVEIARLLDVDDRRLHLSTQPSVVMVCGVNGTGKTTTIGKLANVLVRDAGLKVVVAAADTYRAAATEQLEGWTERVGAGCELVSGTAGGDPGAVAFDAISAAEAREADVVICDTAGRLHTHGDLMAELAKVRKVIAERSPGAPHETLISIDATTGQNGVRQAAAFSEAVQLSGAVLTKLDGSAKGGVALAIADELEIPVKLVGLGEGLDDLRPFAPQAFARGLVGEEA